MRDSRIFYDPAALLSDVEHEMHVIENADLFNHPKQQKLLETWNAAMFGVGYAKKIAACQVAINESSYRPDVDMFLRVRDRVWDFQITEVQIPGRRRGAEYRRGSVDMSWITGEAALQGRREGPRWITQAVESKRTKAYSNSLNLHLLVYANFTATAVEYDDLLSELHHFRASFASIWILTSLSFCSIIAPADLGQVYGWNTIRDAADYYG